MTEHALHGRHILIVEDEYLIADQVQSEFSAVGAVVIGPAGTVQDALDLVRSKQRIDGVVLDVDLRGERTFSVADLLIERGVPFVFLTGYDASVIPIRLQHITRCEKPIITGITRTIGRIIQSQE